MILRRLGNKSSIAHKILPYFPEHISYIEPFFGAGGMFFNKPKAKYNILNDNDDEVYNLFMVLLNRKEELKELVLLTPIHETLWQYWRKNHETDQLRKAVRFLYLSNYGYMGMPVTLKFGCENSKEILYNNIDKTYTYLSNCQFMNTDFRKVISKIGIRREYKKNECFIYCDPPYLDTGNNYKNGFTEQDSDDLFAMLVSSGIRFAVSEFAHPVILEQVKRYGLNIVEIGERQNLKNRHTEILVTNYETNLQLFTEE